MFDLNYLLNGADINHDGHVNRHDQDLNGDGVISTAEAHTILKKIGVTATPGTAEAKAQFDQVVAQATKAGKFLGIEIPAGRSLGWDLLKYKLIAGGHSAEAADAICAKIKLMKYGK